MTGRGVIDAAVRLVLGAPREAAPLREPADPSSVLALLRRNKVPLLALDRLRSESIRLAWKQWAAGPEAAQAIAEEAGLTRRLLDAWRRVADAFDRNGIESVLFKSPGWFPALSSNLDVLVRPSDFREAARILEQLGHIHLPHYREDHKLLFRTFEKGVASLSIHLHEAVSWGKARILDGGGVIARSLPGHEEGTRVSSPLDALAVTIAHTVFETDQVRLGDLLIAAEAAAAGASLPDLLEMAERGGWPVAAAAGLRLYDAVGRRSGGPGLAGGEAEAKVASMLASSPWALKGVERILAREGTELPFLLPRRFSKAHLVHYVIADPARAPDEKLSDLAATAWNLLATRLRLRQRPASLITLSGLDGAGKSRLADAVAAALELCEVPVARRWSRGGFSAAAVAGKARARRMAPRSVPAPADEDAKISFLRSRWKRRLWIWGLVLEQALLLQRVRLHMMAGRTVVGDRWVTDSMADLIARLPADRSRSFAARPAAILMAAVPEPDLALFIDVPADLAHARKSDGGSLEGRRRLAGAYAAAQAGASFIRLDGRLPVEDLAQEAVEMSLRACFARFAGSDP